MTSHESNDRKNAGPAGSDTVRITGGNELQPGQAVGERYQVISLLGKGGMGLVYRVNQIHLNKQFALKTLDKNCMTEISIRRFRQEARTSFSLDHPNIIAFNDFGFLDDQTPFLVMELLNGETLGERLKRKGCLSVEEAIPIFVQVCFALAYAHDRGVVHRDIKPNNIMLLNGLPLGAEGSVKVLDFGIAKFTEHEGGEMQALTRTGEIFGSPLYMSPEQCTGGQVDFRADIYSLGCVFFEALTGAPPCVGENALATMMKHQTEPALSLKQASMGSNFPLELEAIVATMLAKSPDDRYQNLGSVAHDLGALRRGDTISQTARSTKTTVPGAQKTVSMSSAVFYSLIAGVALLSAAIAGVSVYVFHHLQAGNTPAQRILQSEPNESPGTSAVEATKLIPELPDFQTLPEEELKEKLAHPTPDHRLALRDRKLTDRAFQLIAEARWIESLHISCCDFENKNLARIVKLPLTDINVNQSNFDDEGAANLALCQSLKQIDAQKTLLKDEGIGKLVTLKNLESLLIDSAQISDKGVREIAKAKKLTQLNLRGATQVTYQGINALEHVPLTQLDLDGTPIDDRALPVMAKIPTLKTVGLSRTKVTFNGIENLLKTSNHFKSVILQDCPNIKIAEIDKLRHQFEAVKFVDQDYKEKTASALGYSQPQTDAADEEFQKIMRSKNPQQLDFLHRDDVPVFIRDNGLISLKPFTNLRSIDLSQRKNITGSGLKTIAELPALTDLYLNDTNIGDEGISELNQMSRLQHLELNGTKVSDKGLQALSPSLPLEKLNLQNMKITNLALKDFHRFKLLHTISLDYCQQIGDDGVGELIGLPLYTLSLKHTFISNGIINALDKTPSLRELTLANNNRVGDALLIEMMRRKTCPNLRYLDVRNCVNIREDIIQAFRNNRPNCRVLSDKVH